MYKTQSSRLEEFYSRFGTGLFCLLNGGLNLMMFYYQMIQTNKKMTIRFMHCIDLPNVNSSLELRAENLRKS